MTSEPMQRILELLQGARCSGSSWEAFCPAHDDQKKRSLSVKQGHDGRVLLHCFVGCAPESIVAELGLTMSDLYERRNGHNQSLQARKVVSRIDYAYKNAAGEVLAVHKRVDYSDGEKGISWQSADGRSSLNGTPESALPLYRYPELLTAPIDDPVIFCEGEKATDTLRAQGFTATSACGGASQKDFGDALQVLEGRIIYLWPDYDAPGVALMRRIGDALLGGGIAKAAYWLQATNIGDWTPQPKDDAHDFFVRDGYTADTLRACLKLAPLYESVPASADISEPNQERQEQGAIQKVDHWPEPPGSAAFSGLPGEIVRAISPHTESDPVALLLQLLIVFGCIVGRMAHMMVGETVHYARIFGLIVGDTSKARKGDSWSPVRALLDRVDPNWTANRIVSGMSSGEGLIFAVRDPVEKLERQKGGGELKKVVVDEGIEDKRLLTIESEFASVLRAINRQGNILSATIRNAWDRGDLQTLTKATPLRATGAHISIVGHITVDELRRELSSTDMANGFVNRYILSAARRSKLLPRPKPLSEEVMAKLADKLAVRLEKARQVGRMDFTEDAGELWDAMYEALSAPRDGLAGSILARSEAQVLRLSMLYALLDGSALIDAAHLQSAAELWAYSERSVYLIFGDATGDPIADAIYRALKSGGPMRRTEISALFGRHEQAARIDLALQTLLEKGKARTYPEYSDEERKGRPAEYWEAVL